MNKPTLKQRFGYWFDNLMSTGTPAMIGMLAVLSLLLVFFAGIVLTIAKFNQIENGNPLPPMGFGEAVWESLMRTLDPGTMGGDTGAGFRGVMLFVTIGGIFVVSTLIGVLNSAIEGHLDHLRKGHSLVLEKGHTLILGWSPQIFTIISELMIANENQKKARIVVLANQDKVDMETEIRERVKFRGKTKVICRSGSPIDVNNLEIASPHTARSIIILPPESNNPDSYVIKTVLALTNNPHRHDEPYRIVTQIRDEKNMAMVKMVGENDHVLPLLTGDLIARVVAQTSRQSGLSLVYTELMNFGGDEIYFKNEPGLSGKTFGNALLAYEDSSLMGLRKADGRILLNPPMDTYIESGDDIFALSEDDDTITLSGFETIPMQLELIHTGKKAASLEPEKGMLIGWNRYAGIIMRELDSYVAKDSLLTVVANGEDIEAEVNTWKEKLINQQVQFNKGDTTSRELLDSLGIMEYDHVIVLANESLDIQEADAKTLVTLLHLRHIAGKDETPFSIVSEMLDLRNRELAEATQVDDFIVSQHLISLMLAQLSEDADLLPIFENIFSPRGAEIYLKPIGDYVETSQPVNFYTVVKAASQRGETALGYRLIAEANNPEENYGLHTNPKKTKKVTFTSGDKIIVIAER
jgi:hypothetical protein